VTRAYLDHASTSPLRPVAFDALLPYLREHHGDPARLHAEGRTTRVAVEAAREHVAVFGGARPREVVFTSGGTEAVNAAVYGAIARASEPAHVVTTAVEHSSVLDACRRSGADVTVVAVDSTGRYDAADVLRAIRADTALVSVQLANHEVGTLQPAADVCAGTDVLVHVDACAAVGHVPLDFRALGADLCSITAHKLGGPAGTGALLVRRGLRIPPFVVGGAQERARRGGLENVPGIVGFGAAAAQLDEDDRLATEAAAARRHVGRVVSDACSRVDGVRVLGDRDASLPQLVCLEVEGVEAEPILLGLDQHGVAIHSGSACSSETFEPSPVLQAMGLDGDHALRVSVGWNTTDADVDAFVRAFPDVVGRLRDLRAGTTAH
jgi:cysteine desulfurase